MSILPHHSSDPVCAYCEQKLSQADSYLQDWYRNQIKPLYPNSHVAWAFRNKDQQDDCVAEGKSKQPWPTSPHNQTPAMALDLFQINDQGKGVWDPKFFFDVNELNRARGYPIEWGGNFIKLHDYDHYELKK